MNTNLEDYEGVVDRIAVDFDTPDVDGVYQIAEQRHRQRRSIQQGAAAFAFLLVAVGAALWLNQPRTSEVATEPPTDENAIVDTTAAVEEDAVASPTNELRDLFISTQTWTPIARTGIPIPEPFHNSEALSFFTAQDGDGLSFVSCEVSAYAIDWLPDGYTITDEYDTGDSPLNGCDPGQEGIAATPIQTGEKVAVTSNNDGSYTLTGSAWSLTITGETPAQPSTTEAPETTTTTTEPQSD